MLFTSQQVPEKIQEWNFQTFKFVNIVNKSNTNKNDKTGFLFAGRHC